MMAIKEDIKTKHVSEEPFSPHGVKYIAENRSATLVIIFDISYWLGSESLFPIVIDNHYWIFDLLFRFIKYLIRTLPPVNFSKCLFWNCLIIFNDESIYHKRPIEPFQGLGICWVFVINYTVFVYFCSSFALYLRTRNFSCCDFYLGAFLCSNFFSQIFSLGIILENLGDCLSSLWLYWNRCWYWDDNML